MRLCVTYSPVDVANINSGMQILISSNGYFITNYQALEDVQLSQGFTLPTYTRSLVTNNRRSIESQLTYSRLMVFTLPHNPATVDTDGNWYMPVNYHMTICTQIG